MSRGWLLFNVVLVGFVFFIGFLVGYALNSSYVSVPYQEYRVVIP